MLGLVKCAGGVVASRTLSAPVAPQADDHRQEGLPFCKEVYRDTWDVFS
jgi:hypothetical protein